MKIASTFVTEPIKSGSQDFARGYVQGSSIYTMVTKMDGHKVIFDPDFIREVRYALSTGNTATMSRQAYQLFDDFIVYQSTGKIASRNTTKAGNLVELIDDWLVNSVECKNNEEINSDPSTHTWDECKDI
jgi:hypothetical protein